MKRPGLLVPVQRVGRRIAVASIAVVILASLAALVVPRLAALPSDVAFRVAGADVSRTELDRRTKLLASLYGITAPADAAGKDAFRRESARAVATSHVIDRAAADRGIVIPDKTSRDTLSTMIGQQPDGREGFVKLLAEAGASEDDVLEEIRRQQATEQLYGQVAGGAGAAVTDADVRTYYRDHPAEMAIPEQRRLRNVVVSSEGEAVDVLRRVTEGEDFAAVAAQSSLDASSREQGGDLGFVERARLDPTYGNAAYGAAPNALFGPIRSASGWNVGQVLEVRPAVLPPFEQVRPALDTKMRGDRSFEVWKQWMAQAVTDAGVRYADDLRPAPSAAAPTSPGPAGPPAMGQDEASAPAGGATVAAGAPGASFLGPVATAFVLAGAFVGIGLWGRLHVDELVPSTLPTPQRTKRRRTMLRGTLVCLVSGGVLAVLAAVGLVGHFLL